MNISNVFVILTPIVCACVCVLMLFMRWVCIYSLLSNAGVTVYLFSIDKESMARYFTPISGDVAEEQPTTAQ